MAWSPISAKKPVRVAVIGAGNMGRNHLRVLSQATDAEIVAVVDRDPDIRSENTTLYGVPVFESVEEALEQVDLDVAVVATPPARHLEVALPLLAAGVVTLVEKPLAIEPREAEAMLEIANSTGTPCMVGHIERFNPAVVSASEALNDHLIGQVHQVSTKRVGPMPPPDPDCGVLLDLATHDIDVICSLLGERPSDISCMSANVRNDKFEDMATVMLNFSSGVIGTIEVNWLTPVKQRELRLVGSKGALLVDYIEQEVSFAQLDCDSLDGPNPLVRTVETQIPVISSEPLARELQHMVDVARGQTEPITSLEDGVVAVQIATQAAEMARNARTA
jgi:UDP-N-acetylglucosamine 3-dehydrogenase